MKLSDLIHAAQAALAEHGDIDVFLPCPDEGVDDDVCQAHRCKVRQAGSPFVPPHKWRPDDHRRVFVIG